MRKMLCVWSLAIASSVLFGQTVVPASGIGKNVLTNQGVALLAKAGYSESFIIDMIYHKQTQFDVSAEGLAWLAKQGLSERIVRTMVTNDQKDETIAIVPTSATVVPPMAPMGTQTPNVVWSGGGRKPLNMAIEVTLPTPQASPASYMVQQWGRDQWYTIPNIPALAVNAR
jgi:hypothetical protein